MQYDKKKKKVMFAAENADIWWHQQKMSSCVSNVFSFLQVFKLLKVNRTIYIANRTYRFCQRCKKYQSKKRVKLNEIS